MEVRDRNSQWVGVIEHPEREMDRCRLSHLVARDSGDDDKLVTMWALVRKLLCWGVCCTRSFQFCLTL